MKMTTLTDKLINLNLQDQILTDNDLQVILGGTSAARYSMVNKALKKKELERVRRGLYVLAQAYRKNKISIYTLANHIVKLSYVSLESALAFHGWIPEQVTVVTSVLPGRHMKHFETSWGVFDYVCLNTKDYEFLTLVERVLADENQYCLMASPLRALMDYVYIRDIEWVSLDFLTEGLRIDQTFLVELKEKDFNLLSQVYRSRRVLNFLNQLKKQVIRK